MKKIFNVSIFLTMFIICVFIIFCVLSINDTKVMIKVINDSVLSDDIQVLLCYSTGASGLQDSETFFLRNNKLEKSVEHYYLAYTHIFSDERITERFAIPLGYDNGGAMVEDVGQIFDYKNFEEVEVLVLNNWYDENGKLTIMYIVEDELKTVEYDVGDATLLGTYCDDNEIYVILTFENEMLIATLDITNGYHTTNCIPYAGLIRKRSNLLGSNTFIKDRIVYFGEYTANYEKNEIYSTITSFNLNDGEINNTLRIDNELLYHLSSNGDELVALFAKDKDEIGYYQQINCKMVDFELNIKSSHLIQNLPENIDTMKLRDRSRIYDNVLYTIVDGIYTDENHLIAYDLKKREIVYYATLKSNMPKKSLFDWNFCFKKNNVYYDIQ